MHSFAFVTSVYREFIYVGGVRRNEYDEYKTGHVLHQCACLRHIMRTHIYTGTHACARVHTTHTQTHTHTHRHTERHTHTHTQSALLMSQEVGRGRGVRVNAALGQRRCGRTWRSRRRDGRRRDARHSARESAFPPVASWLSSSRSRAPFSKHTFTATNTVTTTIRQRRRRRRHPRRSPPTHAPRRRLLPRDPSHPFSLAGKTPSVAARRPEN